MRKEAEREEDTDHMRRAEAGIEDPKRMTSAIIAVKMAIGKLVNNIF